MIRDAQTALANVRSYRRKLASLVVLMVVGCVLGLGCAGVVAQAADASAAKVADGVALRTIQVRTFAYRTDVKALKSDAVAQIAAVPGVTDVEPWLQADFGIKNEKIGGAVLWATIPQATALPPLVAWAPGHTKADVFPLRPGEAVLPKTSGGSDLSGLLGQTVAMTYTQKIGENAGTAASDRIRVVGLYDPAYQDDGPSAAYVDPALVVKWAAAKAGIPAADFAATSGYQQAAVVVATPADVSRVLTVLHGDGYDAVSLQSQLAALPGTFRLLHYLGGAVVVALVLYSLFSGMVLSSSFVRLRTREIGLMKAVGFRQGRVLRIFLLELGIVGVVAAALGVVAGNLASVLIGRAVAGKTLFGIAMTGDLTWPAWYWSVFLLAIPAVAVVAGGLLPARRAAAMQPDAALREW